MLNTCQASDRELLGRYAASGDEAAFAELVRRHLAFVHASARRQVGPDLAADVAQSVFLVLARKASSLRHDGVLSAWLFRTTRFVAARARRSEIRRRRREDVVAPMLSPADGADAAEPPLGTSTPGLEACLDEALATLSEPDRRFVLGRFFEQRRFGELARELGISEDAAKKRVSRAVERLRSALLRRGVGVSAAVLTGFLLTPASEALPVGLAEAVLRTTGSGPAATAGVSAKASGWAAGALRDWLRHTVLRTVVIPAASLAGVALVVLAWHWFRPVRPEPRAPGGAIAANPRVETADAGLALGRHGDAGESAAVGRRFALVVRDAGDGRALSGVRVLADTWEERRLGRIIRQEELRTGPDGACALRLRDPEFTRIRFWVDAPRYVPLVLDWSEYEIGPTGRTQVVRLERGRAMRGEVRNEAGEPVAGAELFFEQPGTDLERRENVAWSPHHPQAATDESGRFVSEQLPADSRDTEFSVGVRHPSYARAVFSATAALNSPTNFVLLLHPGAAVRGRVRDDQDLPVAGARVRENHGSVWPGEEVVTDTEGRFEFAHVPAGPFPYSVLARGFARHDGVVRMEAAAVDEMVRLVPERPSIQTPETVPLRQMRLVGTVTDRASGAGVPEFRILVTDEQTAGRRLLGDGRGGAFDWTVDARFFREFRLEVEAEGYFPEKGEARSTEAVEQQVHFALTPGGDLVGTVYQPDGRPAVRAVVTGAGVGHGWMMTEPGRLSGHGQPAYHARTDESGRFRLQRRAGDERIQVVHESGCAFPALGAVTNGIVQLEAWGVVEGAVRSGDEVVAGLPIALNRLPAPVPPAPGQRERDWGDWGYSRRTDAEGRFRFTHVPPGRIRVGLLGLRVPDREIDVPAGGTVQVAFSRPDLLPARRPVVVSPPSD